MTNKEAIETLRANYPDDCYEQLREAVDIAINALIAQPEETHEERTEMHACDCVSRQAAIDALDGEIEITGRTNAEAVKGYVRLVKDRLERLPSAQPERTCVNCGRTANNGGWYADGGTRCPIEEHYALPKDGFCHLWEKRNITDDDYPERRTDE